MTEQTILTILINLVALAFAFGMLWQKVKDLCTRIGRIETLLNSRDKRE